MLADPVAVQGRGWPGTISGSRFVEGKKLMNCLNDVPASKI
jgi:hypothetical protein